MRNEANFLPALAVVLQSGKRVEGTEVGAFDGERMAFQLEPGRRIHLIVIFEVAGVQVKGGGLDAAGAEQTPIVDGDEFDVGVFTRVGRGVVVDEGLAKLLVRVGVT